MLEVHLEHVISQPTLISDNMVQPCDSVNMEGLKGEIVNYQKWQRVQALRIYSLQ